MDGEDNQTWEMKEALTTEVEEASSSTKKSPISVWCQRLFTLDVVAREKHYFPVFITSLSILHLSIHSTTFLDVKWKKQKFLDTLKDLLMFFVPCMRPASSESRTTIVYCPSLIENRTCNYDDQLKNYCLSFAYPHQYWRMVSVNIVHLNWIHVIANVSRQLMYGILLERKYGTMRLLVVYWLSELGASLTCLLSSTSLHNSSIGASGAIYGIMFFFVIERFSTMANNANNRIFIVIQLLVLVVLPMTVSVSIAMILKIRPAHLAHLGGIAVGSLFGIGIFGCPYKQGRGSCQVICPLRRRIRTSILLLRMRRDNGVNLELEEPLAIHVEVSDPARGKISRLRCRQVFTLDTSTNEKRHFPIFIIFMSIVHVAIHLTTYINILWRNQRFLDTLRNLFCIFLPCMRPAPAHVREHTVNCYTSPKNETCNYDDDLKNFCFSFFYPHQYWRIITVNLVHIDWLHVVINLTMQLLLGALLERKYGSIRIAGIYWTSNFGACLFALLHDRRGGVGASGAIYGLASFFIIERLNAMRHQHTPRSCVFIQLIIFFVLPMAVAACISTILQLRVGHAAHFGGGFVGFLIGITMFGCLCSAEQNCYLKTVRLIGLMTLSLYFLIDYAGFPRQMTHTNENIHLEMKEPAATRVIEPISVEGLNIRSRLRRFFTLNHVPNEKCHRPIFILTMSLVHVIIYSLIHINLTWRNKYFVFSLYALWMLFLPCMRPTPIDIQMRVVDCEVSVKNKTCYYGDRIQNLCTSFMYPHQYWRMITVNLIHMNWIHLIFNVSRQLLLGILLERKYGSLRIAVVYWLSNTSACLFAMLKDRAGGVGASGAVYGILLLFIVERLNAIRITKNYRLVLLQLLLLVVLPMTITVSIANILQYIVGHSAHFGGAIVGFLAGIGMFGCPYPWKDAYQTICRQTAFVLLIIYFSICLTVFFLINASYIDWFSPRP
ncbi:unnamed protein product [Adineta ricciae]|uniref:rhomboid protease n=1 Tax=Adineta ricciae TaxID=249248 RepID=A0A814N1G6_ADIRI|nr:unnamed protein product [Adineta ricciae]CAF1309561.1 unnamed protein product [Adineta ricciae]